MDIQDLRKQIDAIDDQIISLFAQRMDIASKVAAYKSERNLPILVPDREQEKLRDVSGKAGGTLAEYVQVLYSVILPLSRAWQHRQGGNPLPFSELSKKVAELYQESIPADHEEVNQ